MDKVHAIEADLSAMHDHYLEITIEDTGCGIHEDDLQHIYERFFASDLQKVDPNSSGIGLSYTKELIDLLQGDIQVESELGVGTKFKVYLPCIYATNAAMDVSAVSPLKIAQKEAETLMKTLSDSPQTQQAESCGDMQRKKLLIVEDHKDMQLFVESILADKYEVIKADNGVEGLKKANTHTIDLIVSDVMMPEMDGLTFCKKIKSNIATSHIPVLLLTAKVLDESRIKGFEEGADAYLTKPFNPDLLLARIDNLFQQRELLKTAFNRDFMLTPEKVQLTSPDEELLQKIVEIMEEHMEDTDFNVNQMCKMVHLSHMHFIRKVKQLTGKKPIDLLKSFRLKRAKDLLLQNKLTISETAYKVGYDLPNSFSRAFKKEFGMSPKEFVTKELAEQD
jgi:DNA-binding response OmpR family regulator